MKSTRGPKKLGLASLTRNLLTKRPITIANNLGTVKKLHSVLLPVTYSDKFYGEILAPELEDYCKLVFYNDIPVGLVTLKFEDASASTTRLYLATIGVLAAYRQQGLATYLLENVLKFAKASQDSIPVDDIKILNPKPNKSTPSAKDKDKKDSAPKAPKKITGVYLHVHTANEEARQFWEGKGFTLESTVEDYYTKIDPKSAWLFSKSI